MYEVINEELGIKACKLADLTADQVNRFLGLWEDGVRIGTLTVFFENETGDLVLNKDNEMYDTYKELAETYMGSSPDRRSEIWAMCPMSLNETLTVMENCLKFRKTEKELFRARSNYISSEQSYVILGEICKKYDMTTAASIAFRYGIMQGKRMERAKKKRQSAIA